ncbi:RdgB/HAM1 family non-canonical purine NTP pyrophosphatase [bacterium]|nr:RdgB/HAM1 family non-canonical purine NTP pyrophosphatase [bacterium]
MIITLATSNPHKVDEINLIAKKYDIKFVLPGGDFNHEETGDNFLANAACKARAAALSGSTKLYLADDSGLCVDILGGAPGIYSARYAPSADERIDKLLLNLENYPDIKDRSAKFVCAMVVVNKNGDTIYQVQKECKGYIMQKRQGTNGFGYDPVFFVNLVNKGMAELSPDEKSQVSHRGKSLNEVFKWLETVRDIYKD